MALHLHFDVGFDERRHGTFEPPCKPSNLCFPSVKDADAIVIAALRQSPPNQFTVGFGDAGPEQGERR